ncbi:MAG: DUF1836 domain-containing protein [Erysipelotrichaceae bacterium]|nr:DUF1836 domain-containing protein [Erysipelotrichaceae bacterium]
MKRKTEIPDREKFYLPTYKEIPNVGLYLDQTSKYINEVLSDLPDMKITNSMIANYVKKKLIANPVKKQYGRDQIAYLIFITLSKSALSLDDAAALFELQKASCSPEEAYTYFREGFEKALNEEQSTEKDQEDMLKSLTLKIISTVVSNIRLQELLQSTFGRKIKE